MQIDMSEVKQANFTGNKAVFSGGAIYADDGSTSLSADEYNHTLAAFRFNYCFARFGNEPGNPIRVGIRTPAVIHNHFVAVELASEPLLLYIITLLL